MLMPRPSPGQLYQHTWGRAQASQVITLCSWGAEPVQAPFSSTLCLVSDFSNSEVGSCIHSLKHSWFWKRPDDSRALDLSRL